MTIMRSPRIAKLTLNIGVGSPGDKMDKAKKLLQTIAQSKPVSTSSLKRIPTWGVRPGLPLGVMATVRGKKAEELLQRLLQAVENTINPKKFDQFGSFSFGVPEYIDIPGIPYDSSIGVIGLEVAVTIERPGYRIKRRRLQPKKIPTRHKLTKEESIKFIKSKYGTKIEEEE